MENQMKKDGLSQRNSSEGDFLQSQKWREFQEGFGRRTFHLEREGFWANIIQHELPLVGKYAYVPRGPLFKSVDIVGVRPEEVAAGIGELVGLAKKEGAGWVRIEPSDERSLLEIKDATQGKLVKAPYDVQPKEIFLLDITKTEEALLSEMKSKTRYNINLAAKKGVQVLIGREYVEEFLDLTQEMARRQGIVAHPAAYYRKMLEVFPEEMLKLYCARFEGKIIAANMVLFYGKKATYMHGASSNSHRNVMAPFLLQWQAILDAKKEGCESYDFGGVKLGDLSGSSWEGITNFKLGFSPLTKPVVFPGTYDIVVNPRSYALYKGLQRAKMAVKRFRK